MELTIRIIQRQSLPIITILVFLSICFSLSAQFICYSTDTGENTEKEEAFNSYVLDFREQGGHLNTDIKYIPAVVHIVMISEEDSLSISRVINQIEQTNRHLRRQNIDTVSTREIFKPFAADTHIELCLATQKPDGKTFKGVIWHHIPDYTFNDNKKIMANTILDPDKYFNVWIMPADHSFGFGVFPWIRTPEYDGIVISPDHMGYNLGGDDPNQQGGKIFTHEVGHYLGLYHTFHDGHLIVGDCDFPDCDTFGDRCCDTPPDWSFFPLPGDECNFDPLVCPDDSIFYPQNENYMYYNPDKCLNMFSQDQRIRMRACLSDIRAELCSPDNLLFTGADCSDPTTIIEKEPRKYDINISPNPTHDIIELKINDDNFKALDIKIINILGQTVKHKKSSQQINTINLKDLPNGLYIVTVHVDEVTLSKKIIKY